MEIKTFHKADDIAELERPWEEFALSAAPHTLFNGPVWLEKWFRHLGDRFDPMVATAWKEGRLAAVLPLAVRKHFLGMRTLVLAGAPHAAPCDFPFAGDRSCDAYETMVNEILVKGRQWDLCDIDDVRSDSGLLEAILARKDAFVFAEGKTPDEPFFSLDLRSWPLAGEPSRKHKYNLKRARRKLGGGARVEFRVVNSAGELQAVLPQIFEVHRRRWNGYYTGSLMNTPDGRAFIRDISMAYLERDSLYLAVLALDERVVAYALCFCFNGTLYYYNPAFDPQFAGLSPGSVLLEDIMRDSRERGIGRIEFGKGRLEYKERKATSSVVARRIIFTKRGSMAPFILGSYLAFLSAREAARESELVRRVAGRIRISRI
ncbi:GNAT family N-acetyltransferase [Candidatus Poribacteria bacterium]|nr:GNAT family N-acetyltransferase [Candidatus Poribacteria bacterium]